MTEGNLTKVSGSAFLGKMTILEAFVLPNFLLYFGMKHKREITNAHVEKCTAHFYTQLWLFHPAQHRYSGQRCQIVSLSLYRFLFKQRSPQSKSFQSPLFICSSHRNRLGVRQCPPCKLLPSVVDCMGLHLHGGIINPAQLSSYE